MAIGSLWVVGRIGLVGLVWNSPRIIFSACFEQKQELFTS